ncbi:hypothetical protein STRDD10_01866 [Streptococcus sp. DD10]|nr:hypothetical protein STRDD10_01866 [Streptococcus sp. DD10]
MKRFSKSISSMISVVGKSTVGIMGSIVHLDDVNFLLHF